MINTPTNQEFRLLGVYFPKSSFEFNYLAIEKTPHERSYNISIDPKGLISKKRFKLSLRINLTEKSGTFKGDFFAVGDFEFSPDSDIANHESINNLFYLNAPAIVFPYIRSFIANMSAQSGFDTIHIPTLNLTSLRDELKKNTTTEV